MEGYPGVRDDDFAKRKKLRALVTDLVFACFALPFDGIEYVPGVLRRGAAHLQEVVAFGCFVFEWFFWLVVSKFCHAFYLQTCF